MISILAFFVFIAVNIQLAKLDASKIKQGKRIYHGINGLVYIGLLVPVYLLTHSISLVIGLCLLRIPVFNTALNYFRGLPLTYLSDSTTSIIDQITNFIPKKIGYWAYHSILLAISLILILI